MQNHHSLKHFYKNLILLAIAFSLSGCVKVRTLVDVNPNGSGTFAAAIGMTQQAKALIESQGGDPMQLFSNETNAEAEITRWVDGDYEWVQGTKPFNTLDELNKIMSTLQLLESFSVTRQRGLFKDVFTLEATINPINDIAKGEESSELSGMDPSAFITVQLVVNLPGKVTETNGASESQDSTQMVWSAAGDSKVSVKAISQVWNWVNILAISLVILIIIAITIFFTIRMKKKANIPNDSILKTGVTDEENSSLHK